MSLYQGSTSHPLLQNWVLGIQDARWIIPSEAQTLSDRATWLGANDPFIAALYAAHIQGLMGPTGPRLTSMFDESPELSTTSQSARTSRRAINAVINESWTGKSLDADGVRTRYELECALDHQAFFTGDGFAIRLFKNGVSKWRLIHRDRVRNPLKVANSTEWRDGFKLKNGEVVAINIAPPRYLLAGESGTQETVVNWTAPDGTPNVIHKPGIRLPGMLRGVSRIAPLIVMQRQVGSVLESHVAGKRLQSIFALIVQASSPAQWQAAQDAGSALGAGRLKVDGPLQVWISNPDQNNPVQFTDTKFNGADLDQYLRTCWAVECATLQMPLDVVLCQMGNAPLSSARAGLDQCDRTSQTEQESQIASVTSILDRVAISDAIVNGTLNLPVSNMSQVMVGKYSRPPKYSTDRKKDAETMKSLQESGVSKTTSMELFGFSYEDEMELIVAEEDFENTQTMTKKTDQAFIDRVSAIDEGIQKANVDGLTWPIVLASDGANTAPGAFLAALSKATEQSSDGSADMSNKPQDGQKSDQIPPEDQEPEMAGDTMANGSQYNQGATGRAG
jgi:capsid protein